jgi:hypothetical protein
MGGLGRRIMVSSLPGKQQETLKKVTKETELGVKLK